MELETDFATFLKEIRPTTAQRDDLKNGHKTLRERLNADEKLKPLLVSDFLQGSYRRATAVRPKNGSRSDVDIIVVTKLSEDEFTPAQAMDKFRPFLDAHYKGKWKAQGRSFGIELSHVEIDLVITSAPSETEEGVFRSDAVTDDTSLEEALDWKLSPSWVAFFNRNDSHAAKLLLDARAEAEWKTQPLRIPDREAGRWESTHPLAQIQWTRDKNANTKRHFVNVVKATKWWRLENYDTPKHPKGFPLERIVGECCPNAIESVAEGVTLTLENIVANYETLVGAGRKPVLPDYGVPDHDVLGRISVDDFKEFFDQAKEGAGLARSALDSKDRTESGNLWRKLLGSKFPQPPGGGKGKGFSEPTGPAVPGTGRFA